MGITEILLKAGLAWAAITIAKNRGRDPIIWGALTAFFLFPILFLLFLPPVRRARPTANAKSQQEETFTGHTVDVKPLSNEEEHPQEGTNSFNSVQWFLLDSERKSVGPFPFTDMQQKFWDGDLTEETFVWTPEWKEWKKVGSIPGLLSSLSR